MAEDDATYSGTYEWRRKSDETVSRIRLDVDGPFPRWIASGEIVVGGVRQDWIATVHRAKGESRWTGQVRRVHGRVSWVIEGDSIDIEASGDGGTRTLRARFMDERAGFDHHRHLLKDRRYGFVSPYFRQVRVELDRVAGVEPVTEFDTATVPPLQNAPLPESLANEKLTIEGVFERAGIELDVTRGWESEVLEDDGTPWTKAELNDAMRTHWAAWEKDGDRSSWSFWLLFATRYADETDADSPSYGGLMFDNDGPGVRQGAVVFSNSKMFDLPGVSQEHRAAWRRRARFWAAIHEMGHAFDLAHAEDKTSQLSWQRFHSQLPHESFMGRSPAKGSAAHYFRRFLFRFSDQELDYLRHAPTEVVRMGGRDWRRPSGSSAPEDTGHLKLALTTKNEHHLFEFMEPIVVNVAVRNDGPTAARFDRSTLSPGNGLRIVVDRDGPSERSWRPFARLDPGAKTETLAPGRATSVEIMISPTVGGPWLADPGAYRLVAELSTADRLVASEELTIRIQLPREPEDEKVAQDFFTQDVARVLYFEGSRFLTKANDILRNVATLQSRRVADHARFALASGLSRDFKQIVLPDPSKGAGTEKPVKALSLARTSADLLTEARDHVNGIRGALPGLSRLRQRISSSLEEH